MLRGTEVESHWITNTIFVLYLWINKAAPASEQALVLVVVGPSTKLPIVFDIRLPLTIGTLGTTRPEDSRAKDKCLAVRAKDKCLAVWG